jgi:hypothetical protein
MKIKKFNEEYELDEGGDIGEETAKEIISHYIDNLINDGTLQDSFDLYCKDDLEESERYIVMNNVKMIIIDNMAEEAKLLYHTNDDYMKNTAKRYNI